MGLIGKEVVQSRVWVDPSAPPPPNLNYKYTYPKTVFEAVHLNMDESSPNLIAVLENINKELRSKQPIFQGKPANFLMTYAGTAGAVGAIQMTQDIPWNPDQQSHDKIPTEKAIGDYLMKIGILNPDGSVDGSGGFHVRWSDIVGRPNAYIELGMNEDGFVTQKVTTEAVNNLQSQITNNAEELGIDIDTINKRIDDHLGAKNPHNISIGLIGGVSMEYYQSHLDAENPHHINAATIGLENVNNTSDMNKPISKATQEAIDNINKLIEGMTDEVGGLKFVVDMKYDVHTGQFIWTYNDGSTLSLSIPIDGLVDEVKYDIETKELIVIDLGGNEKRVDVKDLFIRYMGSTGTNITVVIDGDNISGTQKINASINPMSITNKELADDSISTRNIIDQNVTGNKIRDLTITTVKLADNTVTTEKIQDASIVNLKIGDRAVDGRTLFSSSVDNKLLAVRVAGEDPIWTQATEDMIANNAIITRHILNRAVTSDKLGDKSVITARIDDLAVTNEKIASNAITNDKVVTNNIEGSKLVTNPVFTGVPKITENPSVDSNGNDIPNTLWVRDTIGSSIMRNSNFEDRSVDGRVLFTSSTRNRALVVNRASSDPIWGLINNDMMDIDSVNTPNIKANAVTNEKIADKSVETRHIALKAIKTSHIDSNQITLDKIYPSDAANRVVAAIADGGNPIYTKVSRDMLEFNAISAMQIEDRSITPSKIQPSTEAQRVLVTGLPNTNPYWGQVRTNMIGDRVVDGRTLFTSPGDNRILAVTSAGVDPEWLKLDGSMVMDRSLTRMNIAENSIWHEHLGEKIVETENIADWTIQSNNIAPRAITGVELFTSAIPNRVLAVSTAPYSNPDWMQITSDMIENLAITKEKIFQSKHPYRVLGATQAGVPPEYTMITHQFIVDGTIIPEKLVRNFVLFGTPELTAHPKEDANNYQLASTRWVRETIASTMLDFNPEILFDTIDTSMIQDHAIDGSKLFTSPIAPRVLGITAPNSDVEFILIEENLIADGAVTTNKLQRNIHLLGTPTLEVRPANNACDNKDGGQLIPDCQWVMDRINEASLGGSGGSGGSGGGSGSGNTIEIGGISESRLEGILNGTIIPEEQGTITIGPGGSSGGGGGTATLTPNCIITDFLQNRSVTADKLFTTPHNNRVLAVLTSNGNPEYVKIGQDFLTTDRIIDAQRLFTSDTSNRILAVKVAGSNPEYTTINHNMLEDNIIDTEQIVDRAITNEKLANQCITSDKLSDSVVIQEHHLVDRSVTERKIDEKAVSTSKIADQAVTAEKIQTDIELKGYPTVAAHTNYERRSIRNTILSPNKPNSTGFNGDIWFRYI